MPVTPLLQSLVKIGHQLEEDAKVVPPAVQFEQALHQLLALAGHALQTQEVMKGVVDGRLLAVIELKSQVGPSFGNNFNNRTEEAIGSAVDFWTAYRAAVPAER